MRKISLYNIIFSLVLCTLASCGQIEYPEGADTLPGVTTSVSETVRTIYDTRGTTEYVPEPESETTTEKQTHGTELATTISQPESETTVTTVPDDEPEIITSSTVTTLNIEDVPPVGMSEYYANTQTQRTTANTTVNTALMTTAENTVTTPPSSSLLTESTLTSSETSAAQQTANVNEAPTTDRTITVPLEGSLPYTPDSPVKSDSDGKRLSHPYSYYELTAKQQAIYDRITCAMLDCKSKISFEITDKVTFQEVFDTYQTIYNDEYRLYYISPTIEYMTQNYDGESFIISMSLNYTYSKDKVKEMQEKLAEAEKQVLSGISSSMSDYEKVKYLHDYIIRSCAYNESNDMNTVYGTLVGKEALCQGYAHTFSYLCSKIGLESVTVLGVANEEHMWNLVKMDGDWYHIDLTWDDPDRASFPDSVRYDYFGLTDTRIKQLRTVHASEFPMPEATGTKYEYYSYNGLVVSSEDEAKTVIESEVRRLNPTKSSTVQFLVSDSVLYDTLLDSLFNADSDNIIDLLMPLRDELPNKFNTDSIYHNSNSNTRVIKIYLDYTD
ncbi:MAG: transglutaminase domain-containing protein [Huintestinicola sp.]